MLQVPMRQPKLAFDQKIMKVKIGVASVRSGFLSSPEKSRRVQVPMRQPKLAFDQKKHES